MIKKYSFKNDYSEGAHPKIINALQKGNTDQLESYGEDIYTLEAISALKSVIGLSDIDIHFVSGGTQANLVCISSVLKPFESVISANTGHIDVHEAGAIEATGHKINNIKTATGKISVYDIQNVLNQHIDEHMVKPRLVFISNSTEIGTIYKKKELQDISEFCKKEYLLLYLDGARIGSALSSEENDLTLKDITKLTDFFYIGGTKNGAFSGEAVVIRNDSLKKYFRHNLKQRGALLAKGRFFGIQFTELFKNNLYFDIAKHGNNMATKLIKGIKQAGYSFPVESSTNQIFPIFPNTVIEKLSEKYQFYVWEKIDKDASLVRLVTSWATDEEFVDKFISDLKLIK